METDLSLNAQLYDVFFPTKSSPDHLGHVHLVPKYGLSPLKVKVLTFGSAGDSAKAPSGEIKMNNDVSKERIVSFFI